MTRTLHETWAAGEAATGMWCAFGDAALLELVARSGYDYVTVDTQHGLNTWASLPATLRALRGTGAQVLVRVQGPDPTQVSRALDLGADGVVVPMVDTAQQVLDVVAACRYPGSADGVEGSRSYGPVFADHDVTRPNLGIAIDPVCVVQIESRAAYENLDEILAVPGLDVAYVGPYDLAIGLGHRGRTYRDCPEMDEVISDVVSRTVAAGVVAGMHCDGPEMVGYWRERGASMLTAALDTTVVRLAHERLAADVRVAAAAAGRAASTAGHPAG